jgi:class 3 adenylate cyclase/tetratricopeptide (TPR) repeat protein
MLSVSEWLDSVGFQAYTAGFIEHGIDTHSLRELTDSDLKTLGVHLLGHRKTLLRLISELRATEGDAPTIRSDPLARAAPFSAGSAQDSAQRRQITVMFCDLVGSTALALSTDPEDFREITQAFHNAVRVQVENYGGYVARFLGDAVLVYFGYPRANEDDANRAVVAARSVIAHLASLRPIGHEVRTRIGISTGLVVVGQVGTGTAAQEVAASGPTPNLAARLEARAQPGEILVSEDTQRLLGAAFDTTRMGPLELKGYDCPMYAYRIDGERKGQSRFDAQRGMNVLPLIGREAELGLLSDRWSLTLGGEAQAILLEGQPGIGKSRMCRAFTSRLAADSHHHLLLQGSPHFSNSALYPLLRTLREVARRVEPNLSGWTDVLSQLCPALEASAAARISEVLGTTSDGSEASEIPAARRRRTAGALLSLFIELSRQRPLLLQVEDAHWIDPSTDELLGDLMVSGRDERILILITARPEYRPTWNAPLQLSRLTVSRLPRTQSMELVASVARGTAVSDELMAEIAVKADGVPLFVEELTKTALQDLAAGSTATLAPSRKGSVPMTLHDSLMARLDQLGPGKLVAQAAAVIGREFSARVLLGLFEPSERVAEEGLAQLLQSELIYGHLADDDATYSFKHALIRDVAYESMVRQDRIDRHRGVANLIRKLTPEVASEQPELVAYHLDESAQPEQSWRYWQQAGALALKRSANPEAVNHFRRALRSAEAAGGIAAADEYELRMRLANTLILTEGYASQEARDSFSLARLIAVRTDRVGQHIVSIGYSLFSAGRNADVVTLLRDLHPDEAAIDPMAKVARAGFMGAALSQLGRWNDAWSELSYARRTLREVSAAQERPLAGAPPAIAVLVYCARARYAQGYLTEAIATAEEALAHAEKRANPYALAWALQALGSINVLTGRPEIGLARVKQSLPISEKIQSKMRIAVGHFMLGRCLLALADVEQGRNELMAGFEQYQASGGVQASELACMATEALHSVGLFEDARSFLEAAENIQAHTDERHYAPEVERLRGQELQHVGDYAGAARNYELAMSIAREQSAFLFLLRASRDLAALPATQDVVTARKDELGHLLRTELAHIKHFPELGVATDADNGSTRLK